MCTSHFKCSSLSLLFDTLCSPNIPKHIFFDKYLSVRLMLPRVIQTLNTGKPFEIENVFWPQLHLTSV